MRFGIGTNFSGKIPSILRQVVTFPANGGNLLLAEVQLRLPLSPSNKYGTGACNVFADGGDCGEEGTYVGK